MGFFQKLFSADFMPHGHCFYWRPEIVWLHVISDALIAIAYFSIPAILIFLIRKRKDVPFPKLFLLFGAFIFWCGTTHVLNVVTLWFPIYRFDGVAKAITAFVSILTVIRLIPIIPKALQLRTPAELEKANESLRRANEELERANARIVKSERLKDEFLANISHELRTPLTLILAPTETLLARIPDQDEEARRLATLVHNNAVRLLNMINGLLDFAKLEAGKFQAKLEPVHLPSLAKSLFSEFEPLIKQKGLKSHSAVEESSEPLLMDRYLFERILFNLVSNAVKFTPAGGKISFSLKIEEGQIVVCVTDTGIGISKEDHALLFEKFKQLDGTSNRRFEGTGLGLSIVKEFVNLLGGTLELQSDPGAGSLFCVKLPVRAAYSSAGEAKLGVKIPQLVVEPVKIAPRLGSSASLRVLIAEDNNELSSYLMSLLASAWEVRTVADGNAAWEMVTQWSPDILLSDIMMPGVDGYSLCRRIKENSRTADTIVVLATALTDRASLIKGWEAGADEYLFKPFHPTEFTTRLRTLSIAIADRKARVTEELRRRELEDFAYFASHDLKEPVRIITTFSQLLERNCGERLGKEGKEILNFIVSGSKRMESLINDLITYSKINHAEKGNERVDLNQALAMAKQNLKVTIDEKKAIVNSPKLPEIHGLTFKFVQLFQNLISNAIKYSGDKRPIIDIGIKTEAGNHLLTIRDNGMGFDPKYADQIFLIFKRLHESEAYSGTGVGLAICKRIVQLYGGAIWAESQPGEGATFFVRLPTEPKFVPKAIQT